jgi:hypothetical protein
VFRALPIVGGNAGHLELGVGDWGLTRASCQGTMASEREHQMSLRPIRLTVESDPIGSAFTWSYPNSDGKVYVIPTYALTVIGRSQSNLAARGFSGANGFAHAAA